jgi:hypothetical protein
MHADDPWKQMARWPNWDHHHHHRDDEQALLRGMIFMSIDQARHSSWIVDLAIFIQERTRDTG